MQQVIFTKIEIKQVRQQAYKMQIPQYGLSWRRHPQFSEIGLENVSEMTLFCVEWDVKPELQYQHPSLYTNNFVSVYEKTSHSDLHAPIWAWDSVALEQFHPADLPETTHVSCDSQEIAIASPSSPSLNRGYWIFLKSLL